MPEPAHTPGPWGVEVGSGDYLAVTGPEDETICTVDNDRPGAYADATLLAQSPSLLECLEAAVGLLGQLPEPVPPATRIYLEAFRDAIAAARGGARLAE